MSLKSWWKNEPARIVGQVQAGLALAASLGFVVSDRDTAAIVAGAGGLAVLLGAEVVRSKVSSPATVEARTAATDGHLAAASSALAAAGPVAADKARLCPSPPPPVAAPAIEVVGTDSYESPAVDIDKALADFDGLADWVKAAAAKAGKTVPDYLAWLTAGVAHKR